MSIPQIALIGNPNCGKTTLFNVLTGARQRVGNWPGVTVDKKMGHYHYLNGQFQQGGDHDGHITVEGNPQRKKSRFDVVDLPGTYAIESEQTGVSQDELVVRQFVLETTDGLIVNVVDATNLQRNLYLTFQLLDLNRPMVVALNMIDAVRDSGERIDIEALQEQLGCPVVGISASRGEGLNALRETIALAVAKNEKPQPKIASIGEKQEALLTQFAGALPADSQLRSLTRWQLFDLLLQHGSEESFSAADHEQLTQLRQQLASWCDGEVDIALASARYDAIDALCRTIIEKPRQASKSLTAHLDKLALGRWTGIPVFFGAMYLMFLLAINVGSAFIDFFDIFFGTLLVNGSAHVLGQMDAPAWLTAILSNGLGGGIQTVSTFIPVIGAMFLCLSFLEDSGYLARAAMVVDRGMRAIGLPGKAFVPMLVGFGCNVPAIMGTRTLENPRDRLMSIMMIPYMSCGARLPVYALLVAVFFPLSGQNIVFALYLGGIAIAVLTGLVLKYTLLPGAATPFIMELPPYRMPTVRNMLMLTWSRLKSFIIRAGKAIVLMVMVLSFFNSLGTDGTFGNENTDKSVLSNVGRAITPAFGPMGIQDKNWPATVGLFTGIFAKEAVIGTLNALYSQMGQQPAEAGEEPEPYNALAGIKEAFATIPANLKGLADNLTDPLGLSGTLAGGDVKTVAEEQGVDDSSISQIHFAFGSTGAVIAFLIFILLYTPCAAALGAVYREAGAKWTAMVAIWSFVVAYVCATAYYQLTMLEATPVVSGSWLGGLSLLMIIVFLALRRYGAIQTAALPAIKNANGKGCCQ